MLSRVFLKRIFSGRDTDPVPLSLQDQGGRPFMGNDPIYSRSASVSAVFGDRPGCVFLAKIAQAMDKPWVPVA